MCPFIKRSTRDVAQRTATAIHLGNISTRLGRTVRLESDNETTLDDPEAASMLSRKYRDGGHWSVPKMA
jgi:hypothetical protein